MRPIAIAVRSAVLKKKIDNFTEGTYCALDVRDTTPSGWAVTSAPCPHALDAKYYNTYGRRYDTLGSHIFYAQ